MLNFSTIVSASALAFVLASCLWSYGIDDTAAPLIQAGNMAAPVMDGIVKPDVWKTAGMTDAMHEIGSMTVVARPPVAYFGYDNTNLYIAAVIPLSSGTKPRGQKLQHDGPVWMEDAVEIFLDPELTQRDAYQFVVNSAGSRAELKNQDLEWDCEWQAAATVNDGFWSVEISIPFKSLGIESPKPGTILGINLGFDITTPSNHLLTWSPLATGSFHQPTKFGHLILTQDEPVAGAVFVADEQNIGFEISSSLSSETMVSQLNVNRAGTAVGTAQIINAGKLLIPLPQKEGKPDYGDYSWELNISESGKPIYRQSGTSQIAPRELLVMNLRRYFLQKRLAVDLDAAGLELADQPVSFVGTVKDQSGKVELTKRADIKYGSKTTLEYDVSSLSNKPYTIEVKVLDAAGEVLTANSREFVVPETPSWLGSKAGISDKVLPPWGPLKVASAKGKVTVSPDGRKYVFSGSPMPDAVTTAGASIFSGPITMKISVNGKKSLLKGSMKVVKKTPAQVVLQGVAVAGSLKVDSKVTIDFDGNAWIDFKMSGKKAVTVDSFIIEAPVKKKHAKYRYYYPGSWGSSENARALEAKGWGAGYVPYLWLGDDDRGFALYSTSDQYWNNKADTKAVQALPVDNKTVSIRFNVIGTPLKLSASQAAAGLKYTFGFIATPNKKPDKDVWDYKICHYGNYGLEKQYTSRNAEVKYTDDKSINLDQGSLEMWVKVNFDPDEQYTNYDSRGALNRDLLVVNSGSKQFGLYWNIDDRGMRLYAKDGSTVLYAVGAGNKWKQGELHHILLTWKDTVRLYIDGVLTAQQAYTGLIPVVTGTTSVELTAAKTGFAFDELRISDIEREPGNMDSTYVKDANTLLLEHFEKADKQGNKTYTVPEVGVPGEITGAYSFDQIKFSKGFVSTGQSELMLDYLKGLGVKTICFHEHWTEYENYTDTINNQEDLKSLVKACHERGIQLLLYFGYLMADICPEWDPYHLEVLVMPQQGEYIREPKQKDYSVCYNSAWQDFIADGIDKLMSKYDIDGVYLDGTSWPWLCNNTEHGCGYQKPDGTIAGTYSISGARDMVRRIYTIVKSHKPEGQVNIHNSTTMVLPSLGWATSTWDGEQFGSIARGANLDKLFPMDTFRTEFMGRQWGPPSELLCYDIPYTTHEAFSFSLLHDVLVRGSGAWLEEESQLWKAMDLFGRKQAQFKPYWENSGYVIVTGERCYASLYVKPGKGVMCVVSNLNKDALDVKVKLDLKKIKLANGVSAVNAITNAPVDIKNGEFAVRLSSFDYALVWVR